MGKTPLQKQSTTIRKSSANSKTRNNPEISGVVKLGPHREPRSRGCREVPPIGHNARFPALSSCQIVWLSLIFGPRKSTTDGKPPPTKDESALHGTLENLSGCEDGPILIITLDLPTSRFAFWLLQKMGQIERTVDHEFADAKYLVPILTKDEEKQKRRQSLMQFLRMRLQLDRRTLHFPLRATRPSSLRLR